MARAARRIHIPTLDPKFVRERNADGNWLIARFNENIKTLDKLADNLPKRMPWHNRTVKQFSAEYARLVEKGLHLDAYKFGWKDLLDQVQVFGFLSSLRLSDLVSSAVWSIRRNDPLCAAIMARAALETTAFYARFQTKMRPGIESAIGKLKEGVVFHLGPLERELLKTLWASRLDEADAVNNPTNIVTIIDHITKKIPHQEDVGPCYRLLCEVAHPNMLGRSVFLAEEEGQTIISRNRGPSAKQIERAALLGLSWAAGTFPIALTAMQDACFRLLLDLKASSLPVSGKFETRFVGVTTVTPDDLKAHIEDIPEGDMVGLSFDLYAALFPPGTPDKKSLMAARKFAEANGCTVEIRPADSLVVFVKRKKQETVGRLSE